MIITLEQLQAGLIKYIDLEIAPKANGLTKFAVYFIVPSIPGLLSTKFDEIKKSGLFNDLLDEAGNIKLEPTYNRVKESIKKSGKILIPKLNYFVDETDIEKLYSILKTL